MSSIDVRGLVGTHDVVFVTLDTLRYDVARDALARGLTPNLARLLPAGGWERRHTPASFTLPAHQAFFAGFLPTPLAAGLHHRLFAVRFPGSDTISDKTCVFDEPNIVSGFAERGYRTICIGGVDFFDKRSPLGSVLPGLFQESYWSEGMGLNDPRSTRHQVECALSCLDGLSPVRRLFLFLNVSATHQPTHIFLPGALTDSTATQTAALAHVDAELPRLIDAAQRRAPLLFILCSDHGTAFGEDGYRGHRIGHPVVWDVPYAERVLPRH